MSCVSGAASKVVVLIAVCNVFGFYFQILTILYGLMFAAPHDFLRLRDDKLVKVELGYIVYALAAVVGVAVRGTDFGQSYVLSTLSDGNDEQGRIGAMAARSSGAFSGLGACAETAVSSAESPPSSGGTPARAGPTKWNYTSAQSPADSLPVPQRSGE